MKKFSKQNSVDPGGPGSSGYNPFDSESDSNSDKKQTLDPSRSTSSEPNHLIDPAFGANPFDSDEKRTTDFGVNLFESDESRTPDFAANPFDSFEKKSPDFRVNPFDKDGKTNPNSGANPFGGDEKWNSTSSSHVSPGNKYKNNIRDSEALEKQSVQELENYAVRKAEETTETLSSCLKIAEDIRGNASNTLVTLHQQGEQITRTHQMAADMDQDLSLGEKLLGSLGGMFSKAWRPKKTHAITGPEITKDVPTISKENSRVQREKLGLSPVPKPPSAATRAPPTEATGAVQKVEIQRAKQDDALSDLSNILFYLKDMAVDMGTELDRQTKSLDHLHVDVDELNSRVGGANQRARRLLGKK